MIGAVPVVEHEVHEHKTDYELNRRGKVHQIEQTKPPVRDVLQRGRGRWLHQCCGGTDRKSRNAKIDQQPAYQRMSRHAERNKSLQNEEDQE